MLDFNSRGIDLMKDLRNEFDHDLAHVVISGCMGSRGDGYAPESTMSADEAIGISRAAFACGMPLVMGFTVETDGKLPSGESMREAIEKVDAIGEAKPVYYMINCAHPSHFLDALDGGPWTSRIQAIRANASARSHEELEESTELDVGDPTELGRLYGELKEKLPRFNIVGGCCGTDHTHIDRICQAI